MQVLTSSAVALAVTQEVLRLTPPMKVTYRRTMKDLTIGNIDVPEGTDLMLAPRQVSICPQSTCFCIKSAQNSPSVIQCFPGTGSVNVNGMTYT